MVTTATSTNLHLSAITYLYDRRHGLPPRVAAFVETRDMGVMDAIRLSLLVLMVIIGGIGLAEYFLAMTTPTAVKLLLGAALIGLIGLASWHRRRHDGLR